MNADTSSAYVSTLYAFYARTFRCVGHSDVQLFVKLIFEVFWLAYNKEPRGAPNLDCGLVAVYVRSEESLILLNCQIPKGSNFSIL